MSHNAVAVSKIEKRTCIWSLSVLGIVTHIGSTVGPGACCTTALLVEGVIGQGVLVGGVVVVHGVVVIGVVPVEDVLGGEGVFV